VAMARAVVQAHVGIFENLEHNPGLTFRDGDRGALRQRVLSISSWVVDTENQGYDTPHCSFRENVGTPKQLSRYRDLWLNQAYKSGTMSV
jgi:hypothetical protein